MPPPKPQSKKPGEIISQQVLLIIEEIFKIRQNNYFREDINKIFNNYSKLSRKEIIKRVTEFFFQTIDIKEYNELLSRWYQARIYRDYDIIKNWIVGRRVLDYGCGKGDLGYMINKTLNKEVILADVEDRHVVDLPFFLMGETDTDFKDNEFDTTIMVNVVHHTKHPTRSIAEALGVTKKRLIIFEHHLFNINKAHGLRRADWELLFQITEEIFFCPGKKKRPRLNFQSFSTLNNFFKKNGIKMIHKKCIPFFNQDIFALDGWLLVLGSI